MKKLLLLFLVLFSLGSGCETTSYSPPEQVVAPTAIQEIYFIEKGDSKALDEISTSEVTEQILKEEKATPDYAPRGTYTNVDGNEIPRPYYAPSVPAGASAVCRDGTYSFSQNRRGTCSHHGGVARWL